MHQIFLNVTLINVIPTSPLLQTLKFLIFCKKKMELKLLEVQFA